jgi:hypothetical protein
MFATAERGLSRPFSAVAKTDFRFRFMAQPQGDDAMTSVVTPSAVHPITSGQIGKIQDLLGAALRKSGLQNGPTQTVIEHQGDTLVAEMVAILRKRVEAASNMAVRHVTVNRARAPEEMLKVTGREQYADPKVVATMPRDGRAEDDVFFFKLGCIVSDADLRKEYDLRGLKSLKRP